jgi:hypothetical protein
MNIEIDVNHYLTEDDKRDIARQWFRDTLAAKYRENPERIISNAAYYIVSQECDNITPEFQNLLVENVKKVITQLTAHTVFNKPDAWDRDGNSSYHLLKSIVESKRERINNKIEKLIDEMSPSITDVDIDYEIRQMILKRLGWGE